MKNGWAYKMKRVIPLTLVLVITFTIYQSYLNRNPDKNKSKEYVTFYLDQEGELKIREANLQELMFASPQLAQKNKEEQTRAPASISEDITKKQQEELIEKTSYQQLDSFVTLGPWAQKLAHQLLRHFEPETRMGLVKKGSHYHQDKKLYIVQVNFYNAPTTFGVHNYNALVDGETGDIIRTWNQTIHEPVRRDARTQQRFRPSGSF